MIQPLSAPFENPDSLNPKRVVKKNDAFGNSEAKEKKAQQKMDAASPQNCCVVLVEFRVPFRRFPLKVLEGGICKWGGFSSELNWALRFRVSGSFNGSARVLAGSTRAAITRQGP